MLWKLYCALTWVVVPVFLLAYCARYVHPRHVWWLQLLAIGLPVLGIVVTAGMIPAVLFRAWKLFAVYAVLGALVLLRFAPFERWLRRAPGSEAPVLTVMTLNADQRGKRPHQKHAFLRLVEQRMPHLIGLQEIAAHRDATTSDPADDDALSLFGDSASYELVEHPNAGGEQRFLPVLMRKGVDADVMAGSSEQTQPFGRPPLTRTYFEWYGRRAALFNLHLLSYSNRPSSGNIRAWIRPGYWLGILRTFKRDSGLRAMAATYVKQILDAEEVPYIVVGDFNSTPNQWVYAHLSDGLRDAFRVAGRGRGATYHAERPVVRIDYVLVSSEWEVESASVGAVTPSDHLPVFVALRLAEAADK